jgi:magnesium-transporting ATPase (P-type)
LKRRNFRYRKKSKYKRGVISNERELKKRSSLKTLFILLIVLILTIVYTVVSVYFDEFFVPKTTKEYAFINKINDIFWIIDFTIFLMIISLIFFFVIMKFGGKITSFQARILEIYGYSLLFVTLLLQFGVIQIFNSLSEEKMHEYTYNKLDKVWEYIHLIDTGQHSEEFYKLEDKAATGFNWEDSDYLTEEFEKTQSKPLNVIYIVGYLIATILIAFGRIHDISSKRQSSHFTTEIHRNSRKM